MQIATEAKASSQSSFHLTGYFHDYAKPDCVEYVKALLADGWQQIGDSSCYGVVFRHPDRPERVHKVAYRAHEDGWVAFAKYALANPNPHFPAILSFEEKGSFAVADIETLEEMPYGTHHSSDSEDVARAVRSNSSERAKSILSRFSVEMAQAVEAIRENFTEEWKVDLHSGNFMLRGDILVLTDPLSHRISR